MFSLIKTNKTTRKPTTYGKDKDVLLNDFLCDYNSVEIQSLVENDNNGQRSNKNVDTDNTNNTNPMGNEGDHNHRRSTRVRR